MLIRPETPADFESIIQVTREAFAGAAHTCGREYLLPDALRAAQALTLSLVAESSGSVVGHVAFSPVTFDGEDYGWHGAGPLSVLPAWQRRGVGTALITDGLKRLRMLGSLGCVLVGSPDYYTRFGFRPDPHLTYPDVPPEYFMALSLNDTQTPSRSSAPQVVAYHPAFIRAVSG